MSAHPVVPTSISDPINAKILAISEDRLTGFQIDPLSAISEQSGVDVDTVIERIIAMLRAGSIRRVRQTMMSTNLAEGALVAWELPSDRLDAAFDFMYNDDPFSGHIVIRTTDSVTPGSSYRLWTTLKVPQGYSIRKHAEFLKQHVGADAFRLMPAKIVFAIGVGHVRRRGMEPGARADVLAEPKNTAIVQLSDLEWRVLTALKREFTPDEIVRNIWDARAAEAGVSLEEFYAVARSLNERRVVGRFSTFLEHVKPVNNEQATRYNALFHWAVPAGREMDAGREVARHYIITHAYWREGGPEFKGVNIMAVCHGMEKSAVLAHKAAIDEHLREAGIESTYTNVFWGGRSEIKPSEIAPQAYREFCERYGIDPSTMLAEAGEEA